MQPLKYNDDEKRVNMLEFEEKEERDWELCDINKLQVLKKV